MLALLSATSCADLDLNPPAAASSESWFSTTDEVRLSLNDFYRTTFFVLEQTWMMDRNSDDWSQRTNVYTIPAGTLNATSTGNPNIATIWSYSYKNISRANRILEALDKLDGKYQDSELNTLRAEARFFRAYAYARLITLWGDVPFYLTSITPEEAFEMGRTDKATVLEQIYADYDYAAENLPVDNNNGSLSRVDRGAAYAFKARIALYQHDYTTCATAAKACMDLGKYSLYDDYGELFRDKTKNCEVIFSIAHSNDLEINSSGTPTTQAINSWTARSCGGNATAQPSWELLACYEMNNGKTIDEEGSGFDHTTRSLTATHAASRHSVALALLSTASSGTLLLTCSKLWTTTRTRWSPTRTQRAVPTLPTLPTTLAFSARAPRQNGVLSNATKTQSF